LRLGALTTRDERPAGARFLTLLALFGLRADLDGTLAGRPGFLAAFFSLRFFGLS
jgi:hypothetical protein